MLDLYNGLKIIIDFALAFFGGHVGRIRTRMRKSFVAKLALEGFVSCVDPHMFLKNNFKV